MRKHFNIFTVFFFLIVFAGCSGYKYNTTSIKNTDFTQYKTYGWMRPLDSLSKGYFSNDIARTNILETANRELEARGMTYTKDNPDILFRYIAIVNNKSREHYSTPGMYHPWGWGYYNPWMWRGGPWGPYAVPVGRERYRAGHIILEARETKSNTVIWQARGTMEVDQPERAINRLEKLVIGILDQYPVK